MAVGKIGVNTPDPPIAPEWISATPPKAQVVVPVPHRVIALPPVTRDTDPITAGSTASASTAHRRHHRRLAPLQSIPQLRIDLAPEGGEPALGPPQGCADTRWRPHAMPPV